MARPPHARERVLDAFEELLLSDGERAATIDATAHAADVSKGGLLYHFGSKDELVRGVLDRMHTLVDDDIETMLAAPDGPVSYFLRTSIILDDPLARALSAASRLAQSGSAEAVESLQRVRQQWAGSIRPYVRDEAGLELVMLVSDGLYFNNALRHDVMLTLNPSNEGLAAVIDLVRTATAP